jgi:hypothetical protein
MVLVRNLFRFECPCGKKVCIKDKRTRDKLVKMHKKFCKEVNEGEEIRYVVNYNIGQDIQFAGQRSVGEQALSYIVS